MIKLTGRNYLLISLYKIAKMRHILYYAGYAGR
ncbi:hypothetical protein N752_03185 [Desulforamulus aquiferis]|nr:hypothetical protein N752_03185 [Desulforamulus aquiferis]